MSIVPIRCYYARKNFLQNCFKESFKDSHNQNDKETNNKEKRIYTYFFQKYKKVILKDITEKYLTVDILLYS